jgi:hypothetical protein
MIGLLGPRDFAGALVVFKSTPILQSFNPINPSQDNGMGVSGSGQRP